MSSNDDALSLCVERVPTQLKGRDQPTAETLNAFFFPSFCLPLRPFRSIGLDTLKKGAARLHAFLFARHFALFTTTTTTLTKKKKKKNTKEEHKRRRKEKKRDILYI